MRVVAYCTLPARRAVSAALGIEPSTSPPLTAETVDPAALSGATLLYIRLHGSPYVPDVWFGEGPAGALVPALDRRAVEQGDYRGCVVVIGSCYGDQSALVQAFYEREAVAVIAGPGPNYAGGRRVIGADRLARSLLRALGSGMTPQQALGLARAALRLRFWRPADRDTIEFAIQPKEKIA